MWLVLCLAEGGAKTAEEVAPASAGHPLVIGRLKAELEVYADEVRNLKWVGNTSIPRVAKAVQLGERERVECLSAAVGEAFGEAPDKRPSQRQQCDALGVDVALVDEELSASLERERLARTRSGDEQCVSIAGAFDEGTCSGRGSGAPIATRR